MAFSVLVLFAGLIASAALGFATAYGLYRWSRKRWVWALTPLFILFWLAIGVLPLAMIAWTQTRAPARIAAPPVPAQPGVEQPETVEPAAEDK